MPNKKSNRPEVWQCSLGSYRKKRKMSLRDLSREVGVSIAALHAIEHGADPQLTTARKIAEFFRVRESKLWVGPITTQGE